MRELYCCYSEMRFGSIASADKKRIPRKGGPVAALVLGGPLADGPGAAPPARLGERHPRPVGGGLGAGVAEGAYQATGAGRGSVPHAVKAFVYQ